MTIPWLSHRSRLVRVACYLALLPIDLVISVVWSASEWLQGYVSEHAQLFREVWDGRR